MLLLDNDNPIVVLVVIIVLANIYSYLDSKNIIHIFNSIFIILVYLLLITKIINSKL